MCLTQQALFWYHLKQNRTKNEQVRSKMAKGLGYPLRANQAKGNCKDVITIDICTVRHLQYSQKAGRGFEMVWDNFYNPGDGSGCPGV